MSLPRISAADYAAFESIVNSDSKKNEISCGDYLHYAAPFLLPATPLDIGAIREDRNYFGSTDFIISANMRDDQNQESKVAYIWELKAPQCYLFEKDDNNNRFRPTQDYVKAENQLLHYYHQAVGDSGFRQRMGVLSTSNIKIGGLIIGRSSCLARNATSAVAESNVATALAVRRDYLYQSLGVRILTWDRVLTFLNEVR